MVGMTVMLTPIKTIRMLKPGCRLVGNCYPHRGTADRHLEKSILLVNIRLQDSGLTREGQLPAIPIVGFEDSEGFIVMAS
jgi:hypothetical protein